VVRETLRRSGLDAASIGSVVMGNVIQAGNKMNPARQASISGGVPVSVPAMTVNRVCGSGAQAIVTAAQQIATGDVDAAIAGGMENMDRAPYLMDGGRWGYRMGPAELHDSMLRDGVCTEKLDSNVLVMQAADHSERHDPTDPLNRA
jgi:acetyl-CoA C-acetyltransferase